MRYLIALILLISTTSVWAQEDVWVEGYWLHAGTQTGNVTSSRWVPGYWEKGSNGLAYDNFSWRLGDDHFTTPPHVRDETQGEKWFEENWAEGYDDNRYQNPYYEATEMEFRRDVATASRRYAEEERHRLDGQFNDALKFVIREGEWCTITVESNDFDPHLTVLDTDGRLERNEDFGDQNARVDIEPRREGTVLVLVSTGDYDARGRYRVQVRRRPGPLDADRIEDDLRSIQRDEQRAATREEVVTAPPSTAEQTLAPAITQEAEHRWVDDEGGIYQITPATDPRLR